MITIGADPELFIKDSRTGGVVPICGLLGGTKDEPKPLEELGDGYSVQEDNVMAEFNIPPCTNYEAFSRSVLRGVSAVESLVRTSSNNVLALDFAGERLFPVEMLRSPQARQFGCSADFDAYARGAAHQPIRPIQLEDEGGAWRFAGGHVHIGYDNPNSIPDYVVAQMCDVVLGLPSVALDEQPKRRELYGTPGRYRPTPYGIEYRTLSNFWIFDRTLSQQIGLRALQLGAAIEGDAERLRAIYTEIPWLDVQNAIRTEDSTLAADLLAYCVNDLTLSEAA